MKLIKNNADLIRFIPQVVPSTMDEPTLFDRISAQLEQSELWVIDTFTGSVVDTLISNEQSYVAASLVAYRAMADAIPALDLILTPNGFGVVSNSNIAPASKDRVDKLISQLNKNADRAIISLIEQLLSIEAWKSSEQCAMLKSSLIYSPKIIEHYQFASLWNEFLNIRQKSVQIEAWLAENFISNELMSRFRASLPEADIVSKRILSIELDIIQSTEHDRHCELESIVNFIRLNPEKYPEWHASSVAQLFSPPVFENKKTSTAYFF